MESKRDQRVAVILFVVTLACVFLVYGYQWMGGDPLSESATAIGSAKFAGALMAEISKVKTLILANYHIVI